MASFREMIESREATKERGRPMGFSPKGQLLVRDEYGSLHKSAFEGSYEREPDVVTEDELLKIIKERAMNIPPELLDDDIPEWNEDDEI